MFLAIGHTPNTGFLKGQVELTEKGYIKWTKPFRTDTSVEGVFAAGDVADDYYARRSPPPAPAAWPPSTPNAGWRRRGFTKKKVLPQMYADDADEFRIRSMSSKVFVFDICVHLRHLRTKMNSNYLRKRVNSCPTSRSPSKTVPAGSVHRAARSGSRSWATAAPSAAATTIAVTGCVGINADGTYAKTVGEQTARSLAIIQAAIEALGGKMEQVIRTRMYVVDVSKWEEVARVHGSVFSEIRPATTIVEVARLIDGDALIEIEADAIVP